MRSAQQLWLEHAWLGPGSGVRAGVLVGVDSGRFTAVSPGVPAPPGVTRLEGLTLPGLANCHSHVFHRALRGRTQRGRGSFWTWRDQMYLLAERLDPDSYYRLARATYAEMVTAGFTAVGEFHYLHHDPTGQAYADANSMGRALLAAAADVGIRICLLDTVYLAAGIGRPVEGVQRRFSDGDVDRWAARVEDLAASTAAAASSMRVGAALHSVRAVPVDQLAPVASWAESRQAPLHVHVSEQRAENEACAAAYGSTPVELLAGAGVWGGRTTAVHATHLSDPDVDRLGRSASYVCFCPTTERDLGDGIGHSRRLHEAGARLTIGSDSHAIIDGFEEMRAVELDERLRTEERGHWAAADLLTAATATGHESLGLPGGRIAEGEPADLVTLDLRSPRTAGAGPGPETAVFAATSSDVRFVMADGRVLRAGPGDADAAGADLDRVINDLWEER